MGKTDIIICASRVYSDNFVVANRVPPDYYSNEEFRDLIHKLNQEREAVKISFITVSPCVNAARQITPTTILYDVILFLSISVNNSLFTVLKLPEEFRDLIHKLNQEREAKFRGKYLNSRLQFCTGISVIDKNSRSQDAETKPLCIHNNPHL